MHNYKAKPLCQLIRVGAGAPALAFLLAAPVTLPAAAQAPGARALEEVVVTARRREESLQDVPIAVTAIGGEYLRDNNIAEFSDLRVHVPSLSIGVGGSSTNVPQVALRGLRPEEVLVTLDPAVPMYFADVVLTPTHGTNLALYDLANVQVLKGPQGTLFGRNSTGGAILIQPQAPGTELGGYVETRFGNYGLRSVEGAVDLPLNDRVQFRVAGRMLERDGYQSNVADNALAGRDKYWDEDSSGGRVSMNVQFTDSLSNLLVVGYDQNDMMARIPTPLAFNPTASLGSAVNAVHNGALRIGGREVDAALARAAGRSVHDIETDLNATDDVDNTLVSNTTLWQINDGVTFKNIFGYRKVNYSARNDSDGTALPLFGSIASATERTTSYIPGRVIEGEQYSNELQLFGAALDDRLQWLAGAYWYRLRAEEHAPTMILGANPDWPAGPPPAPQLATVWNFAQNGFLQNSPNGEVDNSAYALFAEGTYSLTSQWDLTVGVRQTWDERELTMANQRMGNCSVRDRNGDLLPNNACARKENEKFSAPTWRVVLDYQLNDDTMLYGSVSTGYRSGGFNMRGTDNLTLEPFDEESVLTYELGFKGQWDFANGTRLRTNVAGYLSEFEDIQKTQDVFYEGAVGTNIVNAAEAEVQGVELEAFLYVTQNLEMMLAWSYVDTEYKQWQKPDNEGNLIDVTGADFIWIPRNSANAYVKYTLPLDPALGDISLMVSAYWQDEMTTDDTVAQNAATYPEPVRSAFLATEKVDAYGVVNVRADWRNIVGTGFDFGLWVNNVEDKEYAVGGLTVEDSQGWSSRVYGAPRTYGATVRYTF